MIIIRWSGCSRMFHVPDFIDGPNEMFCYMHLSMLSRWGGGGGGWAKAGDLNSDHLFSSNARPQGN